MKRPPKWKRFWLCCRWGIRGCRIALLIILLILICSFIWFNQVGMPDFAKIMLQNALHERGLQVEFKRMYFQWFKGLVTEDLTVQPSEGRIGPSIAIHSADVDLDLDELLRGRLSVKSIELFQGAGTWRVAPSNQPPRTLQIRELHTGIRFLPDDQWQLDYFNADVQGIHVSASGVITNASLARRQGEQKTRTRSQAENRKAVEEAEARIHRVLTVFERFKFAVPPTITVRLNADARERGEIDARIAGRVNLLNSPFGQCRDFSIDGQVIRAAQTNAPVKASLSLGAGALHTSFLDSRQARAFVFFTLNPAGGWDVLWNTSFRNATSPRGRAQFLGFKGNASASSLNTNEIRADLTLSLNQFRSAALDAKEVHLSALLAGNHQTRRLRLARFEGRLSDFRRDEFQGRLATFEGQALADTVSTNQFDCDLSLRLDRLRSPSAALHSLQATAALAGNQAKRQIHRANLDLTLDQLRLGAFQAAQLEITGLVRTNALPPDDRPPELRSLAQWDVDLKLSGQDLHDARTRVQSTALELNWRRPALAVKSLTARFADGDLRMQARADAVTRRVQWQLNSDFALTNIAHLLGPKTERYLAQYNFKKPPLIELKGSLALPSGSLKGLNWKRDLEPGLTAAGSIRSQAGDYRGLDFLNARTRLWITNQTLILPDLFVDRAEGDARLTYTNDLRTRDYAFGIHSGIDPRAVSPLLGQSERRALEFLEVRDAMPSVKGTIWGRWGDLDRTGLDLVLQLTNIAIRAQQIDRLSTRLTFTNRNLLLLQPRIERPEGALHTERLRIDTAAGRVYLTNVQSATDFLFIPSIIGPKTARAVSRYQFLQTPRITINGEVSTHRDSEKDSNLHFDLFAPRFHWFKFHLTNATARIDWVTNRLDIRGLHSGFYGGTLDGDLWFDFDPPVGNEFAFDLGYTNVALRPLIADVSNPTNRLAGRITGDLHVTSANTAYWDSWQGHGRLALTNGLLWDIPVFGIISPILNGLLPGLNLGNSRANEATGSFVMTNSVIYTDDLVIHSPPVRLYYQGTIDFDANINARVAARAFRDRSIFNKIFDALTQPISTILQHRVYGTLAHPKTEPVNTLPRLLLAPLKPLQGISDAVRGRSPRDPDKKNGGP